ncbi:MAG: SPL family radical SAM protein [Thermoproteota archaeon]
MKIREVECKTILNKSAIADYCVNPYVGCQHGCRYCYAAGITFRFRRRREEWGEFLDVKTNALEVLSREVENRRVGKVFLSSLTDPYQPVEKKYELTRKILEVLVQKGFPVIVQTKSNLVARDLDVLKRNGLNEVGVTVVTLDEEVRRVFEPASSSPEERLEAVRLAKENGLKTYVFFGPILPFLSETDFERLLTRFREAGADYVYVDRLNLRPMVWSMVSKVVSRKYPELYEEWRKIFFSESSYYDEVKRKVFEASKKIGLELVFCY